MKRIFLLLILLSATTASMSLAQVDKKYSDAVAVFKQGKYEQALNLFLPLTSSQNSYPQAEYAHYYYALAAQKLKKYSESSQMLKQLITRFPKWNRIEDAYFLIGINYFEEKKPAQALSYLQRVTDPTIIPGVLGAKQSYLASLKDLNSVKALQKEYPDDYLVATRLIELIAKAPANKADSELAARLVKRFGVEETAGVSLTPSAGVSKEKERNGVYQVAALLPFRLNEFDASKRVRSNQFAYDYYLGMSLAKRQLKNEGIEVNLAAYDVSNDENQMSKLVKDSDFEKTDLLVGPLYPKTFEVAARHVAKAKVVMLNPLSTDGSILRDNDNVYLAHPSIQYQMKETARFAKSTAGVIAAVYYGTTSKDSSMAVTYSEEIKKIGGKVLEMKRVNGEVDDFNRQMGEFTNVKPSHITLFSTNTKSGPSLLSVLNSKKLNTVPVFASASSFDFIKSRPQGSDRLYLVDTDFIDINKVNVRLFQQQYWESQNTLPSVYSYQGYDHLLFFGRMLNKYKGKIKDGLDVRQYDEEYLLAGFNFTRSRENEISPILRYRDGNWVPVK
jgi:ABC-type branched-subunit amino acid transport system substrate-binding protein